jgi:hypothetical protein
VNQREGHWGAFVFKEVRLGKEGRTFGGRKYDIRKSSLSSLHISSLQSEISSFPKSICSAEAESAWTPSRSKKDSEEEDF